MDLGRKAQFFTLDVITKIAFGEAFGDLERDEDMYRYIQSTEEMLLVIILCSTVPLLAWLISFDFIAKLAFPSGKESTGVGRLIGYVPPSPFPSTPSPCFARSKLTTTTTASPSNSSASASAPPPRSAKT